MAETYIASYFTGFCLAALPAIIVATFVAFRRGISLTAPDEI